MVENSLQNDQGLDNGCDVGTKDVARIGILNEKI